jgi:IS30 family transposase
LPIEQPQAIVQERIRADDIEVDFMMGKNYNRALLMLTDQTTLQIRLHKLNSRQSDAVTKGYNQ